MPAPSLPDYVVDPETHEALRPATEAELAQLVARVAAGEARRRSGAAIGAPEGAYLRSSGQVAYLVEEGSANFVIEERVELDAPLR